MALIWRWSWILGLAAAVLAAGGLLGFAMNGLASVPARNLTLAATTLAVAFAVLRRHEVLTWMRADATARGFGAALAVGLSLAISVGLVSLASRHDRTLDLTRTGRNTLSEQSRHVIGSLSADVVLTAFATPLTPGGEANARLLEQAREQSDRITVAHVNPIAEPARAREAGVTGEHGIVFVQTPGRPPVRLDGTLTETDLVSGLVEATSAVLHRVCWAIDHGEADPDDETSPTALGGVRTALERLNYQVTLTRLVAQGIDPDCEVLVIARPRLPMVPEVIAKIDAYVLGGGQLFAMLEPEASPALARWLGRFGIVAPPEPLMDPQASYQVGGADPSALWLPSTDLHPIVTDLDAFAFVGVRAVDPSYDVDGTEVDGVVWTSGLAQRHTGDRRPVEAPQEHAVVTVARVDAPRALGPLTPDAPPLTLRAGGRLVVVGDADFASVRGAQLANNTDLFLNTIAWLVREPAQVGARAAPAETLRLSQGGLAVHMVLFIVLWPGLAMAIATVVLIRRRQR